MPVSKASNFGNPHIGLFAKASDGLVVADASCSPKFIKSLSVLGCEVAAPSFGGVGGLAGLFCALNSNGIILPSFVEKSEIASFKKLGLNAITMPGRFSATGNNIAANDFGAIANPELSAQDTKRISDCLGVEVVRRSVAGYLTPGSCLLATNKGFLAHNRAGEEELKELQSILRVGGANCTLNTGTAFVSICAVSNSHAAILGESSTGFEVGRAAGALGMG